MRSIAVCLIVSNLAIAAFPRLTLGQPLLDRVPGDAIVYVGWRGAADVGPGYAESRLKAVLQDSSAGELLGSFLPNLAKRAATEDEKAAKNIELLWEMVQPLWRHPTVFYFGGVDLTVPESADLKLAILCDAGGEAPKLLETFKRAVDEWPNEDMRLMAEQYGDVVVLASFNFTDKPETTLAADENFKATVARTAKDAVITLYVEHEKLLDFADLAVTAKGKPDAQENWPKLRTMLRLDGVKRFAWTAGFDGRDWADTVWIDAPSPRSGLLAAFEGEPVADEALNSVPKDATLVSAGTFDLGKLLAETRKALAEVDPDEAAEFEKNLARASLTAGVNVETELIGQLGPQWITYASPSVAGRDALGMVVLNRPKDAAKVDQNLDRVAMAINNTLAGQMKNPDDPRVRIERSKINELDVHYWAVPLVSPAWTMKDGTLFAGAFPQVVVSAAKRPGAGEGDSIRDNSKFQELGKRFGPEPVHAFQYSDLPAVASDGYTSLLMLSRFPLGLSDLAGVTTPPLVIPPLEQIQPHLVPMGSATRIDDKGFWFKCISPFPGAAALGMHGQGVLSQPTLLMNVLIPALRKAERAPRRAEPIQDGIDAERSAPPEAPASRPLRPRPGNRPGSAAP